MKAPFAYLTRNSAGAARFKNALLFFAVALTSFGIYMSNGQTLASYDSAPNSLLAFNVFERHQLDLDVFRGSYFTALGGQYAFQETPSGHLTSAYPVGTAIVTLPIYAVFYYVHRGGDLLPAIDKPAFEPLRQRYEKIAAAIVAAMSVGLFMLCAQEIGNFAQAGIATAVYALATSMWSIGSQALWQHGPVNLLILAMVYAFFRADRSQSSPSLAPSVASLRGNSFAGSIRTPDAPAESTSTLTGPIPWLWLVLAGICAGFLPVIRPTAILFSVAGLIFALWTFGRQGWLFALALAIGAAPGAAWNAYFFHSLLGGYGGVSHPYDISLSRALVPFAGLLVSPSRGLFSFSPVLVFSVLGAVAATRVRARTSRLVLLLAAASAILIVQYAFFRYWWAGYAYGPRFLTDIAGVAALLLVYVIPARPQRYVRSTRAAAVATAAFSLMFCFSIAAQFVGLNSGAAGSEWNSVPISVDRNPERVWPIADNQIERNLKAAYFRFFAWQVADTPNYARGVAARVTSLSPSLANVAPGALIDATAGLDNSGVSRVFGYDTGVYVGQMRIRVRIVATNQQEPSGQHPRFLLPHSPRQIVPVQASGPLPVRGSAAPVQVAAASRVPALRALPVRGSAAPVQAFGVLPVQASGQVLPDQYLYVRGAVVPGERTDAVGTLTMPQKPGSYELECAPVLVGGTAEMREASFRIRIRVG